MTILDDDRTPEASISDTAVAEGGTARMTVSLDRPYSKEVTVWWQTADGTAGSGDHSAPSAKQKITFKAGETSKVIEIDTVDDAVHEGSETFTVTLSDPAGATLGTDHTATVTIKDDDPVPKVSVADATVTEGDTARVTVSLDRPSTKEVTVWWQTADGTAGSGDYTGQAAAKRITFRAGETSKTIEIATVQDSIREGSETFTVTLSGPSGAKLGTDRTATVTIEPTPQISVSDASVTEGGAAQVTVSLDRPSSRVVTVLWQASDGTAGSGDYTGPSAPQTITFRPGETSNPHFSYLRGKGSAGPISGGFRGLRRRRRPEGGFFRFSCFLKAGSGVSEAGFRPFRRQGRPEPPLRLGCPGLRFR